MAEDEKRLGIMAEFIKEGLASGDATHMSLFLQCVLAQFTCYWLTEIPKVACFVCCLWLMYIDLYIQHHDISMCTFIYQQEDSANAALTISHKYLLVLMWKGASTFLLLSDWGQHQYVSPMNY